MSAIYIYITTEQTPLSEPMLSHEIELLGTTFSVIWIKIQYCSYKKMILKYRLQNGGHFLSTLMY